MYTSSGFYKGEVLDKLLVKGYFRCGNDVFTTNSVLVDKYGKSDLCEQVFWLRLSLTKAIETKKTKRIRKKCANLYVNIKIAEITVEIDELYAKYFANINFDGQPNCKNCLPELNNEISAFYTYMIEIRDRDKLIGIGYFDKGEKSVMSVLHFYHPDYKKYSIGKYLMLITKDFAIGHQMDFVYPGYFMLGDSKMDYKIFPQKDAIKVYLPEDEVWVPLNNYTKDQLYDYFQERILGFNDEDWEVNEQLDILH